MKTCLATTLTAGLLGAFAMIASVSAQTASAPAPTAGQIDRSVLPIPEPKTPVFTELDARNAKPPVPFRVAAPTSAPPEVGCLCRVSRPPCQA